jgi:ribosome-associated protein
LLQENRKRMIEITHQISIDESELQFDFIRASGPGGQNVNKVSSAVQLRFDVANSHSLPEEVRQRLARIAAKRINKDGVLVLEASRFRTQEQNRQEAIERLVELVRRAAYKPRPRKHTRPTAASIERRLEKKRQRSEKKKLRRRTPDSEW